MHFLVWPYLSVTEHRVRDFSDLKRLSANMAIATLNTGSVGVSMGLSFWDCFIVILVVNLFSDLLPAWTAAFGLTGLRMTTFSYVRELVYYKIGL